MSRSFHYLRLHRQRHPSCLPSPVFVRAWHHALHALTGLASVEHRSVHQRSREMSGTLHRQQRRQFEVANSRRGRQQAVFPVTDSSNGLISPPGPVHFQKPAP